jgi:hypothetical protein
VSRCLGIALRYNRNTLGQTVLAAIAWLGVAVTASHASLAFTRAMATLSVAGRVTFRGGDLPYPTRGRSGWW